MYTLFNTPYALDTRVRFKPTFTRIKDHVKANLERVSSHYKANVYSVPSDHLLVQLIQTLPTESDVPLNRLVSLVEDYIADISRAFQLPSAHHRGRSQYPGVFLGETGDELILLTDESFSLGELRNQWESMSAVRFLHHPHSDFSMPYLNGGKQFVNYPKGYSVIAINLPMLVCQYHLWRTRELRRNPTYPGTTMHFVARYVLPNALSSYQDVAYLNVVKEVFSGSTPVEVIDDHPFYFNSRHQEIVYGIKGTVRTILDQRVNFAEVLELITPLTESSLQRVVALPDIPKTRQVAPTLIAARVSTIGLLIQWAKMTSPARNRQAINQVRRSLRQLRSMNFSQWGSDDLQDEIGVKIASEIELFL